MRDYVPEGSTIIFEAPQRRGKTMAMVAWAWDEYSKGRTVFSTIQLGFPHQPLDFSDMKLEDGSSKFYNGHVVIDELNFFYDARRSLKRGNIEFGAYLLQQKKQGCNITGTTHDMRYLDLRLRQHHDFVVKPQVYPAFPHVPKVLGLEITNGPLQPRFKKKIYIPCEPFMGLYDSFGTYDPFKDHDAPQGAKAPKPAPAEYPRRLDLSKD